MRKSITLAVVLFGLSAIASSASATVIASTLGSGSYIGTAGSGFGGSKGFWEQNVSNAAAFTSGFYASLDQIDLALSHISGTNSGRVSLWTSNGTIPDVMLASWDVFGFPNFGSSSTALVTISGISGVSLHSGVEYFLAVGPINPDDDSGSLWNQTNTSAEGKFAFGNASGWQAYGDGAAALPAFDVIGHVDSNIPEPATIALVLVGAAGVVRLRGRKRAK